jgi:hypothetical protein
LEKGLLLARDCGRTLWPIEHVLGPQSKGFAVNVACNAYLSNRVGLKKKHVFRELNAEVGPRIGLRIRAYPSLLGLT